MNHKKLRRLYREERLQVVRELEVIIVQRGQPATCLSDSGTELTSLAVLRWCKEMRIE